MASLPKYWHEFTVRLDKNGEKTFGDKISLDMREIIAVQAFASKITIVHMKSGIPYSVFISYKEFIELLKSNL